MSTTTREGRERTVGGGYASLGPSNETGITRSTFENKVVGGYVNAVSSAVEEKSCNS